MERPSLAPLSAPRRCTWTEETRGPGLQAPPVKVELAPTPVVGTRLRNQRHRSSCRRVRDPDLVEASSNNIPRTYVDLPVAFLLGVAVCALNQEQVDRSVTLLCSRYFQATFVVRMDFSFGLVALAFVRLAGQASMAGSSPPFRSNTTWRTGIRRSFEHPPVGSEVVRGSFRTGGWTLVPK